jgi:DNA-binding MarR family transcriptional regulator
MANSRPKRPKAPPPRLNLEEMEHDPSMRGLLSFLEISPAEKLRMLRQRAQVEAAENTQPATVASDSAATVVENTAAPVAETPTATVTAGTAETVTPQLPTAPLWCAEGNAGIFPNSRVRRILRAEDVLTRTEQAVYDILWGAHDGADRERLSSAGYDVLARQAGVTKMNAKRILERLIDKGFLKVESLPDTLRRIPTRYRVYSYAAALDHMARRQRTHVVRTGNGILFAHELPATVVAGIPATVHVAPAETVDVGAETT